MSLVNSGTVVQSLYGLSVTIAVIGDLHVVLINKMATYDCYVHCNKIFILVFAHDQYCRTDITRRLGLFW